MNFGSPLSGKKLSRSLIVAGVLTTSLFLTSCSTSETVKPTPAPSSSASTEASATPEATTSPTAETSTAPSSSIEGERVETAKGVYIQKTLSDDFAGYDVDPALVTEEVSTAYTPEEIASAQKFIVDFMSTEGVNSAMNNGGQTAEEWFAEHKDLIHPDFQEELSQHLSGESNLVVREDWQFPNAENDPNVLERDPATFPEYNYVYGENETRLQSFTATPTEYILSKSGGLGIRMDVQYSMKVDVTNPGWPELQDTVGSMAYSVARDGNGGWLLTSYQHDIQTIHPVL